LVTQDGPRSIRICGSSKVELNFGTTVERNAA